MKFLRILLTLALLGHEAKGYKNLLPDVGSSTKVLSRVPNITIAKRYMHISGAAYCFDLPGWNCASCLKAKEEGQEYAEMIRNEAEKTLALFTINKAAKEIVLAFRGTFNYENTVTDVSATKVALNNNKKPSYMQIFVDNVGIGNEIMIHSGYLKAANSLYPQVLEKLSILLKMNKGFSLTLTGHSLGAAMASVVCYMLKERYQVPNNFPTPTFYSFFGFGEPRVGNKAYADYWNKQVDMEVTRVVNNRDTICHVPQTTIGFVHHGTEVWIFPGGEKICSREIYEDPDCSNSVANYPSMKDHVHYWDVNVLECAVDNPGNTMTQFFA